MSTLTWELAIQPSPGCSIELLSHGKTPHDNDVLSLNVAEIAQTLAQCFLAGVKTGAQLIAYAADFFRLLCLG